MIRLGISGKWTKIDTDEGGGALDVGDDREGLALSDEDGPGVEDGEGEDEESGVGPEDVDEDGALNVYAVQSPSFTAAPSTGAFVHA